MKTNPIYIQPEIGKEEAVRHLFSLYAEKMGFTILNIQKSFPDCIAIDNRNNNNTKVNIEFEYEVQNFIMHGHKNKIKRGEKYIIVCWNSKGIEQIPSYIEVIVLSEKKFINIKQYINYKKPFFENPQFRIIGFNTSVAGGRSFAEFENTKIFCTNIIFKKNKLPKGSVIILYQKSWLIGEFTVESYVYLPRPPRSLYEKKIYGLTAYPVTVDPEPVESLEFYDWLKGHIIYTDFKIYDPPVNFSILKRNMSHGGSIVLSFNELQLIRGRIKR